MEETFTHHPSTSRSVSPTSSLQNRRTFAVKHTHTRRQYSRAPSPVVTRPLSCGDLCEPRCHGNWTPHSGPWREDTEPYLSTFTSQSVTWPALVLQLERRSSNRLNGCRVHCKKSCCVRQNPCLFSRLIKQHGATDELKQISKMVIWVGKKLTFSFNDDAVHLVFFDYQFTLTPSKKCTVEQFVCAKTLSGNICLSVRS